MQVLIHLGLNKCASSYVQQALAAAQGQLRRSGVFYPVEGRRTAQYGLSRHYGFGPEAPGLTPRSLGWLASEAARRGCGRIILSSEYLSLCRPAAITRFMEDLATLGAEARFLLFSRPVEPWVRSLFNQYVKTVESGPHFRSLGGFIDHVLANGAIDLARRYRAWAEAAGPGRLAHIALGSSDPPARVLEPFSAFAGMAIPAPPRPDGNRSLSPGALYLTGLLRQAAPSAGRDRLLGAVARSDCAWVPVPEEFLAIDPARATRLRERVTEPFEALLRSGSGIADAA